MNWNSAKERIVEAANYILDVCTAALRTVMIMPPIVYLTYWLMVKFGVQFSSIMQLMPRIGFGEALTYYLTVGVVEEAMFRYCIQDCILGRVLRLPAWAQVGIASALFGAAHLGNARWPMAVPQAVGAAFAGVWFGYLYRKRGLHFAMLTHGLYDFIIWMC